MSQVTEKATHGADDGETFGRGESSHQIRRLETLEPSVEAPSEKYGEPPETPYTVFSTPAKQGIVCIVALAGFFSPLSANIYFPALNYIGKDLHVSLELMNLTITAYLICQGIVPSMLGDLADMLGRRPVYIMVFLVYFAANVGLAVQDTYPALLILRILQSSGSSGMISFFHEFVPTQDGSMNDHLGTIALAISVMADIAPPHKRGKYIGAALCGSVASCLPRIDNSESRTDSES